MVDGNRAVHYVPPCHTVPFHHQVRLAAPVCYLASKADECYFLFRALYCRFFVGLHTVSSGPNTILPLCKTFEALVFEAAPDACHHCESLRASPLSLVFPWLFCAFSGFLDVEQVLLLWDRMIAYESVEVLAIAAAAIFTFRHDVILQCTSAGQLHEIFGDLGAIQVIPLMQALMFRSGELQQLRAQG